MKNATCRCGTGLLRELLGTGAKVVIHRAYSSEEMLLEKTVLGIRSPKKKNQT